MMQFKLLGITFDLKPVVALIYWLYTLTTGILLFPLFGGALSNIVTTLVIINLIICIATFKDLNTRLLK